MPRLSHTFLWGLPKATLALASLVLTSSSISTVLECTAKICELFHYVESLSVDGDVGFNVGLPWSGLVHHLSLLGADCEPKVVAGIREFIDAGLHVHFRGSVEGAVSISKLEVIDGIC